MWHVSSRRCVATLRTAIHLLLTYFSYLLMRKASWSVIRKASGASLYKTLRWRRSREFSGTVIFPFLQIPEILFPLPFPRERFIHFHSHGNPTGHEMLTFVVQVVVLYTASEMAVGHTFWPVTRVTRNPRLTTTHESWLPTIAVSSQDH